MKCLTWVTLCALLNLAVVRVDAASIGINFRRGGPNFEQNMAATESAGFVPQMNWNNSDGAATGSGGANITGPTVNSIVDNTGAVVPLTLTWSANGTWSSPNSGPGDLNMMAGYIDDTGTAGDTVLTVSGVPYQYYDVYTYVGSDANNRSGRTRLFSFFANDRWFRTNTSPFTSFAEGSATTEPATNTGFATYTHYRSLNTSSFELRGIRGSNNIGIHGIQIVETDGSVPPNWLAAPTQAPAAPATLLPGVNSIGLNFVGGRADAAQPDGHAQDDGIVTGLAGVPGVAQSNWNNLFGPTGASAAGSLLDKGGASLATASVTWTSNNLFTIEATVPADQDANLMKGYLDTNNTSTSTVEVAGLPSDWLAYDVYVYLDGDSNAGRAGNYTITSLLDGAKTATVSDTANWNVDGIAGGTFVRANENAHDLTTSPGFTAGNYLVFPGRHDLAFTLTAQGSQAGASPPRAPISGIQIVATQVIPEPSTIVLVGLGLALIPVLRRRLRS
jgi:hypothetical protein